MNGRIYDPSLGRFMSVDPFIQSPTNTQSINGYSYIMNNPVNGTDPSGYKSIGSGGYYGGIGGGPISIGAGGSTGSGGGASIDPVYCSGTDCYAKSDDYDVEYEAQTFQELIALMNEDEVIESSSSAPPIIPFETVNTGFGFNFMAIEVNMMVDLQNKMADVAFEREMERLANPYYIMDTDKGEVDPSNIDGEDENGEQNKTDAAVVIELALSADPTLLLAVDAGGVTITLNPDTETLSIRTGNIKQNFDVTSGQVASIGASWGAVTLNLTGVGKDIVISMSVGVAGITAPMGTMRWSPGNWILNNQGMLGNAARAYHNRWRVIDNAIKQSGG